MTSLKLHKYYKWEVLALLCLAFFLHQGDRAIFGVVLSAMQKDLQLSNSQVGLLATTLFLALAFMMPAAGYVGDVFSRRWVITCSLVLWSTATMFTGMANGLLGLIVFRSVATAWGESFYAPAAYPLIASFHTSTRTIAMSIHQASLYVAMMITGFLAGFIADRWGWRSAFYLYGVCGILLGGLFVFRLRSAPPESNKSREGEKRRITPREVFGVLLHTPTALLITVSYTAVVLVNNAYVVWAPSFIQEKFNLSMAKAGGIAMFFQYGTSLLGVLIGGMISDRLVVVRPRFRLQSQSAFMLLCAPAIVLMGLANSLTLTCCGMIALGLFKGIYQSNQPAALFDVIEPRYRSSALGVQIMLGFLIGSVSPWVLGYIRESVANGRGLSYGFAGLSSVYVIGGLALIAALMFTFRKDRYIEEPLNPCEGISVRSASPSCR
jgi:MFS family permease